MLGQPLVDAGRLAAASDRVETLRASPGEQRDDLLGVRLPDEVARTLQQVAQPLFVLTQGRLSLADVGDVLGDPEHAMTAGIGARDRTPLVADDAHLAVGPNDPALDCPRRHPITTPLLERGAILRVDHGLHRLASVGKGLRCDAVQFIHIVGPIGPTGGNIVLEVADPDDPLGFAQASLTVPQDLLRARLGRDLPQQPPRQAKNHQNGERRRAGECRAAAPPRRQDHPRVQTVRDGDRILVGHREGDLSFEDRRGQPHAIDAAALPGTDLLE